MTAEQRELKLERALNGVLRRYVELRALLPAALSGEGVPRNEIYRGCLNRLDAAEREARGLIDAVQAEREQAAAEDAGDAIAPVTE